VRKRAALVLVTTAHGLGSVSILAVAPLSPFLLDGLDLSRVQVGLFLPAAYLGGVLLSLPAGWLTERRGVRLPLVAGQALTGSMVVLAAFAPDLPTMLACLLVAGFGFSVLNPATGKAIVEWFPPRERGQAMGIKQTGLTLGGIASAMLLPPVGLALGWRTALGLAGSVSLASALLVALFYRAPSPRSEAPGGAPIRFGDVGVFLQRPSVLVVFSCGLAPSESPSSTPRGSWPSPISAAPPAASAGASSATGSSPAAGVPASPSTRSSESRPSSASGSARSCRRCCFPRSRSSPASRRSGGSGSTSRLWPRSEARARPGSSRGWR
jgi:MFS family permease